MKTFKQFNEASIGGRPTPEQINKEYDQLMKKPIGTLRAIISRSRKVVDVKEFRTKDHVVTEILVDKHGRKAVSAAFDVTEAVKGLGLDGWKKGPDGKWYNTKYSKPSDDTDENKARARKLERQEDQRKKERTAQKRAEMRHNKQRRDK